MSQTGPALRKPLLVQAPVRALDQDGVLVASLGMALFAAAAVVCWLNLDTLTTRGEGWWLDVSLTGFGVGLIGLAYCLWRRRRRRSGASRGLR